MPVGGQALGGGASGWYARSSSRLDEGTIGCVGAWDAGMWTATADGANAAVQCASIVQPSVSDVDWDGNWQPWPAH